MEERNPRGRRKKVLLSRERNSHKGERRLTVASFFLNNLFTKPPDGGEKPQSRGKKPY